MPPPVRADTGAEATYEQWKAAVAAELGSDPAHGPHAYTTEDGIVVEPLYAAETASAGAGVAAAVAPLIDAAREGERWMVRHRADAATARVVELEEAIAGGADSLELDCTRVAPEAVEARLGVLVRGVVSRDAELSLHGLPDGGLPLLEWIRETLGDQRCSLGIDPLASWASASTTADPRTALTLLPALARRLMDNAGAGAGHRLLRASGVPWHDAGATSAWTIACVAGAGVEYLRTLAEAGIDAGSATRRLELVLPVGARLLESIAAVRAMRLVWARVLEALGASPTRPVRLLATHGRRELTRRDPWNNVLRTTLAAVAGAIGGADGVLLPPRDARGTVGRPAAARLARTTGLIVREEAGLARIIDPAGGSWCLDALTGELAACAWQRLAELDAAGGMAEALRSGLLAERLAATRRARETLLRTRARPVLGVSAYPAPVGEAVVAEGSSGMLPSRFVPQGDAAPFERLRDAADGWAAARGGRPRLVLRLLGEPRTAGSAAGLARSVGEAGGLEVVVGEAEPGAALALCLGRGVVPTELTAAIEQGHDGRAAFVLVATGTNEDAPPSDATAAWLRPESDVVTLLEQLHRALGVLP